MIPDKLKRKLTTILGVDVKGYSCLMAGVTHHEPGKGSFFTL
jgi:hypothetical protein